jgi:hypothetical protein
MKLLCIIYNFVFSHLLQTSYKGGDERFIENNITEQDLLFSISKNINILDKVHYLEMRCKSSEIDDKTKQILYDHLNYYDIKPVNFRNGGLMMDWDFDIE